MGKSKIELEQVDAYALRIARKMGKKHVMVRYDPERSVDYFTVVIDGVRICDTDRPLQVLAEEWRKMQVAERKERQKEQKGQKEQGKDG